MSINVRNNTEEIVWESIDALMNELRQVVKEGRKIVDPVDILDYILKEVPALFGKEEGYVLLRKLRDDIRFP